MPTYYVDTAVGADINAGTSEGAGNAWATIDHAMNNVIAGDKVFVKASGSYLESPTIDTVGNSSAPIIFEGYGSTPGDNVRATIDGESTRSFLIQGQGVSTFYIFKNWRFTGATSDAVINQTGSDNYVFFNCRVDNNGGDGVELDNGAYFIHCQFDNNARAYDNDNSQNFILCEVFGNTFTPVASGAFYLMCLLYEGQGSGAQNVLSSPGWFILNTLDGDNTTANMLFQYSLSVNFGNVYHDAQGDAVNNLSQQSVLSFWGHNFFSQIDGSNYTTGDLAGVGLQGYGDVSNDVPAFEDEANNDYRPTASSPFVDMIDSPGLIN